MLLHPYKALQGEHTVRTTWLCLHREERSCCHPVLETDSLTLGRTRGEGVWEEIQYGDQPMIVSPLAEILGMHPELCVVTQALEPSYTRRTEAASQIPGQV